MRVQRLFARALALNALVALVVLVSASPTAAQNSPQIVSSTAAPAAIGPYSQAISAGGFVFFSGQIGLDPASGQLAGPGIEDQTRRVMANLSAVLGAAKLTFADVVKTTIYMTNIGDFATVNKIYAESFTAGSPPARATVQVAALPRGAAIEIDAIALAHR